MQQPLHLPLQAYRPISLACVLLLTAAFILQLLVGISLPIIKPIYLLRVYSIKNTQPASTIATELRFGVFGVCASNALNPPTLLDNPGDCFGPQLGYEIPESITSLIGIPDSIVQVIMTGVLVYLVLHLIAAGFAFVALFSSMFLASHGLSILSLILSIISALLGTVVFALDIALAETAKSTLPQFIPNGFAAQEGNGVWMVLVAMICTWAAVVLLSARLCHCCGVRRHRHHHHNDSNEKNTT